MAGRIPIVAVGVPACGVKGRLARLLHRKRARTKRSGGVVVLLALDSRRAFVVAKRCGVRRATSGSSQRDRLRVEGSLARWLLRGRPNWQRVFDGAKRERVRRGAMLVSGCAFVVAKRERVGRPEAVGLREAYPIARSGGLVELPQTQAAGPRNPRCEAKGVEGTAATVRSCSYVVVAPAPAGGCGIAGNVGSSLPRNPHCAALGVEGVAATGPAPIGVRFGWRA